ncbi:helix-turn-helix domain-containing protein [Sphingomonas sp. R86521]|uniref:AraC family transcriptional regulator n=1 Tax=Sphingomonas sp. R86521 TaxID=3093860 RepID=UPI0036D39993
MIESGSHTPGVSVAAFRLPANAALRFEQPDVRLAGYLTDYHVLDSVEPDGVPAVDWMLPSWPAIRIFLSERRLAVTLRRRTYDPIPVASLYGTTSQAMEVTTNGGVTIGVGISALGWARLVRRPADGFRDRITPLGEVLPPAIVDALVARLRASDQGPAVKGILDDFFLEHLGPPNPDEPAIRQLAALIVDDETRDLPSAAAAAGISEMQLRRLSTRYFGFPPKTLLIRTRFLRSFLRMLAAGGRADYSLIARSYHDVPHFLRDAEHFLGMTPRRFMALDTPKLDAVLRARAAVLGAATSALQPTR